uniref:Uncharacterized protein n=1 Tax=Rhizophagus irregularis (strain DAOM 181602 / DAOM 197198 / MUCL 43194) TaxID=747089 RepID=U9T5A7_RHIID
MFKNEKTNINLLIRLDLTELKPQFCDLELPVVLLCHIKFNHQIVGFLVEF